MRESEPIRYSGQEKGNNYVPYLGKFWNELLDQSRVDKKRAFWDIRALFIKEKPLSSGTGNILLKEDLWPIQTKQEQDNNFVINGVNSTETILSLQTLTGLNIDELKKRMLPDDRSFGEVKIGEYYGSSSNFGGFIKPNENLLDVMAKDNEAVLQAGLTHQEVAKPMIQIFNAHMMYANDRNLNFEINGKKFESSCKGFPMFQHSPFNDGISVVGINFEVKDTKTNESFSFSALTPLLIHRYGFYEENVHYRIDPKKAIEFFR